jgi:hypothetical protein
MKKDSGVFTATTSSLTVEVMTVSKAMSWFEEQMFSHACFLSDAMNMLKKIGSE